MDDEVQKAIDQVENNTLAYSKHIYENLALLDPEQRASDFIDGIDQMIWGILVQPNFSAFEYGMLCAYLTIKVTSSAGVYTLEEALIGLRAFITTYVLLAQGKPLPPETEEALTYFREFANVPGGD